MTTATGVSTTRAERAAEVRRRRSAGETWRETCERMGISRSYYFELLSDPEGRDVRARKNSYRGTCVDCGAPTDGSNGPNGAPQRCNSCTRAFLTYWTRDRIIEAIRAWARQHGRPPTATEWQLADLDHPCTNTVVAVIGWANAIEAAGFPARRFNTPLLDNPGLLNEVARRYHSGDPVRTLAAEYGVSLTRVYQWLKHNEKAPRSGNSRRRDP